MKKFVFSLMMALALTFSATAQQQQAQIALIKKAYAAAKKQVAESSREEAEVYNRVTIMNEQMLPGAGMQHNTTMIHFTLDCDNEGNYFNRLYFATRVYNIAAQQFYEEYLFDKKTGRLMFCLIKNEEEEYRYYFGANGKLIKSSPTTSNSIFAVSADNAKAEAARITAQFKACKVPL